MSVSQGEGDAEFDPVPILAVLERHRVEYVVVGGYAAVIHGATRPTEDIDITPATTEENLARLAAALAELEARIRTDAVPEGLPFSASAGSLRGVRMLNLRTAHGVLDLTFTPAGTSGFDDLRRSATLRALGSIRVRVAALEDVIGPRRPPAAARTRKPCPSCTGWPDGPPRAHRRRLRTPSGRRSPRTRPLGSPGREPPAATATTAVLRADGAAPTGTLRADCPR